LEIYCEKRAEKKKNYKCGKSGLLHEKAKAQARLDWRGGKEGGHELALTCFATKSPNSGGGGLPYFYIEKLEIRSAARKIKERRRTTSSGRGVWKLDWGEGSQRKLRKTIGKYADAKGALQGRVIGKKRVGSS